MKRLLLSTAIALSLMAIQTGAEAKQRSHSQGIVKTNIKAAKAAKRQVRKTRESKKHVAGASRVGHATATASRKSSYSSRRARLLPVVKASTPGDIPVGLVDAVIAKESRYDVNARGSHGEIGLMQLLPSTARRIAKKAGNNRLASLPDAQLRAHLTDPANNIRLGVSYLRTCHKMAKGNIAATIGCYNAGPANMWRWSQIKITRAYVSFVRNHMANEG